MKLTPSDKQFEYLRSIGAWNDGHPAVIPDSKPQSISELRKAFNQWRWWWTAILCGIIIVVLTEVVFSSNINHNHSTIFDTFDFQLTPVDSTDLDIIDTSIAVSSSVDNNSKSSLSGDAKLMIVTLLLLFCIGSIMSWWLVRYLINAIRGIALSAISLPPENISLEYPVRSQSSIPRNHIRRLGESEIPIAEQLLQTLVNYAKCSSTISRIPIRPTRLWSMGFATHTGNVRKENQDYGICFRIDEWDVIICADGMGGLPEGQRASFLAVFEAAKSILQQLGTSSTWRLARLAKVLNKTLAQSQHILSVHGDKLRITNINGGLRTTIIIVLAKNSDVHYGYIGDGSLDILKTSGRLVPLMIPQKHGQHLNVLTASLGPQRQGEFVIGQTKRSPGDLIIVSTDGIADRIDPPAFARDVMRNAIRSKGDLHTIARQVVREMASTKDEHGYVCDDNLTLALLGTGQVPTLGSGFWNEETLKSDGSSINKVDNDDVDLNNISMKEIPSWDTHVD